MVLQLRDARRRTRPVAAPPRRSQHADTRAPHDPPAVDPLRRRDTSADWLDPLRASGTPARVPAVPSEVAPAGLAIGEPRGRPDRGVGTWVTVAGGPTGDEAAALETLRPSCWCPGPPRCSGRCARAPCRRSRRPAAIAALEPLAERVFAAAARAGRLGRGAARPGATGMVRADARRHGTLHGGRPRLHHRRPPPPGRRRPATGGVARVHRRGPPRAAVRRPGLPPGGAAGAPAARRRPRRPARERLDPRVDAYLATPEGQVADRRFRETPYGVWLRDIPDLPDTGLRDLFGEGVVHALVYQGALREAGGLAPLDDYWRAGEARARRAFDDPAGAPDGSRAASGTPASAPRCSPSRASTCAPDGRWTTPTCATPSGCTRTTTPAGAGRCPARPGPSPSRRPRRRGGRWPAPDRRAAQERGAARPGAEAASSRPARRPMRMPTGERLAKRRPAARCPPRDQARARRATSATAGTRGGQTRHHGFRRHAAERPGLPHHPRAGQRADPRCAREEIDHQCDRALARAHRGPASSDARSPLGRLRPTAP